NWNRRNATKGVPYKKQKPVGIHKTLYRSSADTRRWAKNRYNRSGLGRKSFQIRENSLLFAKHPNFTESQLGEMAILKYVG
ncbi:MAG: hypothetical protein KDA84_14285, partial [Planctomycetaceae bacterium]|nr:hypothetical protein [Planctomycetaceae bacterium]